MYKLLGVVLRLGSVAGHGADAPERLRNRELTKGGLVKGGLAIYVLSLLYDYR